MLPLKTFTQSIAAVLTVAFLSPTIHAQPSTWCEQQSKASAPITAAPLICQSSQLSELDQQLRQLQALAKMPAGQWQQRLDLCLLSEQPHLCLQQKYQQRLSQLQIHLGQVKERGSLSLYCPDFQMDVVFYPKTEIPSATIAIEQQQFTAYAHPHKAQQALPRKHIYYTKQGNLQLSAQQAIWQPRSNKTQKAIACDFQPQ